MDTEFFSPSWRDGMFLQPQTFQQSERYFNYQLHVATKLARSNYYGFLSWSIDAEALVNWRLNPGGLSGQTKGGLIFTLQPGDTPSVDLNAPEYNQIKQQLAKNQPVDVFLAFPAIRPNERNVFPDAAAGIGMGRFRERELELPDIATGGNSQPILVKALRPQIHFSADHQRDFDYLRLCRLRMSGQGLVVDTESWVPVLHTDTLPAMQQWLQRIDDRLEAYLRELDEYFRSSNVHLRNLPDSPDTEYIFCFQFFSELRAWLLARRGLGGIDPRTVYQMLCQTLGRLVWIWGRDSLNRLPEIPMYTHDDCWVSWQRVWDQLESCFIRPKEKNERELPLRGELLQFDDRQELIYHTQIDRRLIDEGWRFYIGVFVGDDFNPLGLDPHHASKLFVPQDGERRPRIPDFFDANNYRWKMGTQAKIQRIAHERMEGVIAEYDTAATSKTGLSKRKGWLFFDIKQNDYWVRDALQDGNLCLRIAPEQQWQDSVNRDARDIRLIDPTRDTNGRFRFRMSLWAVRHS